MTDPFQYLQSVVLSVTMTWLGDSLSLESQIHVEEKGGEGVVLRWLIYPSRKLGEQANAAKLCCVRRQVEEYLGRDGRKTSVVCLLKAQRMPSTSATSRPSTLGIQSLSRYAASLLLRVILHVAYQHYGVECRPPSRADPYLFRRSTF